MILVAAPTSDIILCVLIEILSHAKVRRHIYACIFYSLGLLSPNCIVIIVYKFVFQGAFSLDLPKGI